MVREVSARGQGRPEAKGGKQSRHLEKEHSSQREGQVYWLRQKLKQKAKGRGKEYIRGQETLSYATIKALAFIWGKKGSHLPGSMSQGVMSHLRPTKIALASV